MSLIDPSAIREALERDKNVHDVTRWNMIREAARDWLRIQEEGETIRWCEVHKRGAMRGQCGPDAFYKEPCRMVERLVVPLGDNE